MEEYIPESEMMFGRNHIRRMLSHAEGYDMMQFRFWRHYLTQMALSCFEWEGVPAGIDTRAIEYILLHWGIGALFTDEGGHMFAQAGASNMLNMYYNPNRVILTAPNGSQWFRNAQAWVDEAGELRAPNCVLVFDNLERTPLDPFIRWYAVRLAKCDRIADINVQAQKTPWLVTGGEETKRTRKEWVRRLASNDQYIELNSNAGGGLGELPQVLVTEAPYIADKVIETKQKILNEALTMLGIDNTNNEKRERQIVDEVLANNEQIGLMRRARLECRKEFCERANTLFGLDMSVKFGAPHLTETNFDNVLGVAQDVFDQR